MARPRRDSTDGEARNQPTTEPDPDPEVSDNTEPASEQVDTQAQDREQASQEPTQQSDQNAVQAQQEAVDAVPEQEGPDPASPEEAAEAQANAQPETVKVRSEGQNLSFGGVAVDRDAEDASEVTYTEEVARAEAAGVISVERG